MISINICVNLDKHTFKNALQGIGWVHAKLLQLCLAPCNPMDYSPTGFFVHGTLGTNPGSGLPCSSSRAFSQGSNLCLLQLQMDSLLWATWEAHCPYWRSTYPASRSLLKLASGVQLIQPQVILIASLLSVMTRYFKIILYIFCPRPRTENLREHWSILAGNSI